MEFAPHPLLVQLAFELVDVAGDFGSDVGVHGRGGEALELAKLWRHRGRGGDKRLRKFLADNLGRALLVTGVDVGKQKTDRDRVDASRFQLAGGLSHLPFVQRRQDRPQGGHEPLTHGFAIAPLDQHAVLPGDFLLNGIMLRALMPADVHDIPVPGTGDHAGDSAVLLQDGVGRDGRAMQHMIDLAPINPMGDTNIDNPFEHALRGIVRCGRHLVNMRLLAGRVREHHIGERATDVDANELHCVVPCMKAIPGRERRHPCPDRYDDVCNIHKTWERGEIKRSGHPKTYRTSSCV